MTKGFTDDELLTIAREHQKHIASVREWEKYRRESKQSLPHSQTFVSRFGSWNQFKERLNLELNDQNRPVKYSDAFLYETLERYGEHYTGVKDWNNFAEVNDLPAHHVYIHRLGEEELYEKVGFVSEWTTEKLKRIILDHFPDEPPTKNAWMALKAKTMKPSYQTIIRRFGSWQRMKYHVYYAK